MDWREILQRHGFTESSEDLVELWTSPRSARGEWIVVRFEDVFQKTVVQWESHTILRGVTIAAPASEECLVALMNEMGVPRGGGA